jgi:Transposase DDE domain
MESTTVVRLLLRAVDRVNTQAIFDRDAYESRRTALPGSRLLKVLVLYQMLKSPKLRGLIRTVEEQPRVEQALGARLARNTLSNALGERDLEQMLEAWMLLFATYVPFVARLGRRFARLAVVDGSLIKLSLQAYSWAHYEKASGAAKMTAVYEWAHAIPKHFVFTTGKVNDARAARAIAWAEHWTYVFDRAYLGFAFLAEVLDRGAHFVVRFKKGVHYRILERFDPGQAPDGAGIRLLSDWTVSLPGWPEVVLRMVSYELPHRKLIRVLTDRFDLTALSVAQLYKERWKIENWWKWVKSMFKVKEPLGRSPNALPVQIVGAFVTDLLLRAFKHSGGFTSSLYEFVTRCQELSLVPIDQLPAESSIRRTLEAVQKLLCATATGPAPVT